MATNNKMLQKRYERIRREFEQLSAEKEMKSVRKYTYEEVLNILSEEFCYSAKTIENICTGERGRL